MRKQPPAKFVEGGHTYNFFKFNTNGKSAIWRCDKRGSGCRVRIHTDPKTNEVFIIFLFLNNYLINIFFKGTLVRFLLFFGSQC